ncbi:MAG: hypothetical protein ACOC34_03380, partial [Thermotogota bacterium]
MRKKINFIVTVMLVLLALTGCLNTDIPPQALAEGLTVAKTETGFDVYAAESFEAIEIVFHDTIDKAYNTINVHSDFLIVKKETSEGKILSLVKTNSPISQNERLFSIDKIEKKDIKDIKILREKAQERASTPLPNGISLLDITISPNQPFNLLIYAKNISQTTGTEFTLQFDSSAMIVDPAYLEDYLKKFGTFGNSLIIKNKTTNSITISAAFQKPVDIGEELIFKIRMKALSLTGSTNVTFTNTSALDSNGNPMSLSFSPATVEISDTLTPDFLGDFNSDNAIGLSDFQLFAQKYGSSTGDGIYDQLYDIGPAQDYFKGDWDGLYDNKTSDGKVNIIDFVVFTNNYGIEKPTSTDQPPSAPTTPNPVNNAENISLSPLLQWQESVDPEGDPVNYDVYLDQNAQPSTLIDNVTDP